MRLFNKPKKYRKEEDPVYIGLLRLACVSDFTEYNDKALNEAIEILNQLPYYSKVHWRLLPLLNAKAKKLNVFEKLKPDVQQLLKEETQKGIIRELAKEPVPEEVLEASGVSALTFGKDYIIPKPMDSRLCGRVAKAVALAAVSSGVAALEMPENYMA